MKPLFFLLAVACTGEGNCNNSSHERTYTVYLKNGKTVEACGYRDSWSYPDCLNLYDVGGNATVGICGVERWEFGVPTPPPPAENPRQ